MITSKLSAPRSPRVTLRLPPLDWPAAFAVGLAGAAALAGAAVAPVAGVWPALLVVVVAVGAGWPHAASNATTITKAVNDPRLLPCMCNDPPFRLYQLEN